MSTSLNDAKALISDVSPPAWYRQVPAEPVTRIRPSKSWEHLDFAELWAQREVFYFLMWRDLKVRYKQTIIGAAWVILQPMLITLVFAVFVIEIAALTLALGLLGASLNVRYRDVGTVLPILLQVWMFVSPIVYASTIVPPRLRFVYAINPLAGIIEGARSSLFNLPFR